MIQHGALDTRVPLSQASELNRALVDHKVPVRMVVYKKMAHGASTPALMQEVMEENLRWFGRYLWGDRPASSTRLPKPLTHPTDTSKE